MELFDSETAVVTGAGNGIGRAIAQALVREGVDTIFADINADTVSRSVAECDAATGKGYAWTGDLGERSECSRLLDFANEKNRPNTFVCAQRITTPVRKGSPICRR